MDLRRRGINREICVVMDLRRPPRTHQEYADNWKGATYAETDPSRD